MNTQHSLFLLSQVPTRKNGREYIWARVPDAKIENSVFFSRKIGSHGPFVCERAPIDAVATASGCRLVYARRKIWL